MDYWINGLMDMEGKMSEYTTLRNLNRGYMKLEVWQKAIELHKLISETIESASVDYKSKSQILDAAQSVSSNISEGYSRRSIKEYLQFLYVSLGSLSETLTRSIGLLNTKKTSQDKFHEIDVLHYEVGNKLLRLVESLQKKKDDGTWNDRVFDEIMDYNPNSNNPLIQ